MQFEVRRRWLVATSLDSPGGGSTEDSSQEPCELGDLDWRTISGFMVSL